ncbi:hypothetical protein [Sphingomonas sp. 28-62-11]|uniref:hypothetical protein n=1 Tax=Sphingomonas sp. 28-62-11 TaxID=1970432 RepID=UPI000BCD3A1F|nr:MAG: hypothetical protein B7Y49_02325 [Sphingomonas sp. 28-62-11]
MAGEDSVAPDAGRGFRRLLLRLVIVAVIIAWVGAGVVALSVDANRTRMIAVAVAAPVSEIGLYIGAALLGMRVFEARRAIWRRLTGRA